MIKSLKVINDLKEQLVITLTDANPSHGLLLTNMEGIGPVKGNINVNDYMIVDGGVYNSARIGTRNIIIDFLFTFAQIIEDARQLTYRYFPVKKNITLIIETDNRTLRTTGYVESNEPNIFSKEEGCRISIVCPNPFFIDQRGTQSVNFFGIDKMFEFPFSNESLTEDLIEFGNISSIREEDIFYSGDVDTGMTIEMTAKDIVKNIEINNLTTKESLMINTDEILNQTGFAFGYDSDNYDTLIVNTNPGSKTCTLLRGGKRINVFRCVDRNSKWIGLTKGNNTITYSCEQGSEKIDLVIKYSILYSGV